MTKDPSTPVFGVRLSRTVAALAAAPFAYGQPTGLSASRLSAQDDEDSPQASFSAMSGSTASKWPRASSTSGEALRGFMAILAM